MRLVSILILSLVFPFVVFAEELPVTRSEGLSSIWSPLNRPAKETYEEPFQDIPESHPNYLLITYTKARGVLEDGFRFYPDEPLRLNDALLWLLRSRNVAYPDDINYNTIETYGRRYGLVEIGAVEENIFLTNAGLNSLIHTLDNALKNEKHIVSFYADAFAGRNTAFGEIFDPSEITAAHKTLPHNTLVRVKNLDNNLEIVVRINDRGPYIDGRDMDLSHAAFKKIGNEDSGILRNVTFERLGSSEVVSSCRKSRYRKRLGRTILDPGIPTTTTIGTKLQLSANRSFKMLMMRIPGKRSVRMKEWTRRGEEISISFDREGTYVFVMHEDSGKRRRFRTKVSGGCL
ncbi:septal ring lytic transglycosylase RlpA family protein [Candidatus Peribacteria bacterium]|nr:septal ring lytic transglycosylase RlpA family protein [Candidatus Peribacteria bacterium]MBT4240876.1 septal ring lytic transglycosylase RlpA family protein [Candidatus Peribacteria bacterium]